MLLHLNILFIISIIFASALTTSPLNLGLWTLFTALITAIICSSIERSWFALLLFLIYIGGILVVFAYFITISPNQETRLTPLMLLSSVLWLIFILLTFNNFISSPNSFILSTNNLEFSPFFYGLSSLILLLLGLILFIALILVVKLTIRHTGPLRPFKYVLSYTKNSSTNQNYK